MINMSELIHELTRLLITIFIIQHNLDHLFMACTLMICYTVNDVEENHL